MGLIPTVFWTDADQGLYQIVQSELASVGVNMSITSLQPAHGSRHVLTAHS